MGKYSHKSSSSNRISIIQTPQRSSHQLSGSSPIQFEGEEGRGGNYHTSIPITNRPSKADNYSSMSMGKEMEVDNNVNIDTLNSPSSFPKSESNIETDKTENIWRRIGEVTGLMKKNVDDATQRGERLEDIEAKTAAIEEGAQQFRKSTSKVQRKLWWKSKKIIISIVGAIILLLLLIGLIIFLSYRRLMNPFSGLFSRS